MKKSDPEKEELEDSDYEDDEDFLKDIFEEE